MGMLLSGVKLLEFDQVLFVSEGIKLSHGAAILVVNGSLMQGWEEPEISFFLSVKNGPQCDDPKGNPCPSTAPPATLGPVFNLYPG